MASTTTEATVVGPPGPESDIAALARVVADALTSSVAKLREDDATRLSQFTANVQEELATLRKDEGGRIARLERAIKDLRPTPVNIDPTTHFWTVYKKVADEHDDDMVAKYAGDLDTSLLFAGLFSAVATTFIVQIIPSLQPNPIDLTNALLLRILLNDTSFNGADPLAPIMNVPPSVLRAQSILFASLAVTLFVAFTAVLGKQWILYYTRGSTWGSIIDRGKERQDKFVGLQRWGLHFIMESLPVMLQFALLLFSVGLVVYLWDLDLSAAEVILVVIGIGVVFYACIAVVATVWKDCPFQTPLSIMLPKVLPWTKETTTLARVWLKHGFRRRSAALLRRLERMTRRGRLSLIGRLCRTVIDKTITPGHPVEDVYGKRYSMTLSNPTFWRHDPLFTTPPPKDTAASAGFWLLENSTDFSAATAVAAVFSEFQWPSHHPSTTALIRLRDTYEECFRTPKFDKSSRLKALQSSAAYYVLYHTWLIWSSSKSLEIEVEKIPPELPPDLFVYNHGEEWDGDDLFEYLLHTEDRSEPVTSARFLSYIAPYWCCGDSDSAIKFRTTRLEKLPELINVLENSQALVPATLTDCVLSVGAAMDFPLHPEDLIRVDKSNYFVPAFKIVVQHIHGIVLARGRRHRHAAKSLEILLSIAKNTTLPLVETVWINQLLKKAAEENIADEEFILFLSLSARRKEEDSTVAAEIPPNQDFAHVQDLETDPLSLGLPMNTDIPTLDHTLFNKIMTNIQTCVEGENGWHDEAIYGGLIVIRDIRLLEFSLFGDDALQTFSDAMENRRPFRVRKAAYDALLVTQDQWLKPPELRPKIKELDFFRKLHGVVVEIARSEYQRSFLMMVAILSEDEYWQPYLRSAMDIWVPFRHEGPVYALRTLTNIGELLLPREGSPNPVSPDESLEKRVEDEWAAVPGRSVPDLAVDRLKPLVEVTEQFIELSTDENYRKSVLAMVERVIPSLDARCESGYGGPGEEVSSMVDDLAERLRTSQSPRRRPTNDW